MADVFKNLDWSFLANLLLTVIPALVCIIFHEVSHGVVAMWMGDNTAKNAGRLTLNPIKHLDIFGLMAMMLVHFGWAKPVPINPANFKSPKRGMAVTALAGPVSNLLLAVAALFIYGVLLVLLGLNGIVGYLTQTVGIIAYFSVSLAVFNIIPIPPMDGSKVLFSLFTDETYFKLMRYEQLGLILILLLSISGRMWGPLGTAIDYVYNHMTFIAKAGVHFAGLFVR